MIELPGNFEVDDIKFEQDGKVAARHIIYATPMQINLLSQATTWYMDGTFKVVRDPYVQLFGIHAFIRSGHNVKQVPLVNVLMSRRQAIDYIAVFNALINRMEGELKLEEVVLDFELATWQSLKDVFPDIDIYGCHFHYSNAIYKKVQDFGLSNAYRTDERVKQLIKCLFALPLLPLREMMSQFSNIQTEFEANGYKMQRLYNYVAETWFGSSVWEPRNICVYQRLVRTNNDVEGYHRRLNHRLGKKPPIYELIQFLHKEAKLIDVTCKSLTSKIVTNVRRKQTRAVQAFLTVLWKKFEEGDIDGGGLLLESLKFTPSFST